MMSNVFPAPAKVNLHLAVTNVRDDGLHDLHTSFVYVDVADNLDISLAKGLRVTCSIPALSGEKNLVFRVLQAFRKRFGVTQGLRIHVNKALPAQAGLGGGSSDAATALMVANQLWGVGCNVATLIDFAAPLGADIPCFLFGQASLAQGVGEQLTPYPHAIPDADIVLAWPGSGVSTAEAFDHFDRKYFHALTDESGGVKVRARSDDDTFGLGVNDLEQSALDLCQPLQAMLSMMRSQSIRAWMSGSGSACVALCHSPEDARQLAEYLKNNQLASWVHTGKFLSKHPLMMNIGA